MCIYKIVLNKASTRERAKRPLDHAKHAWEDGDGQDDDGQDDDGQDDDGQDEEEEEEEKAEGPKKRKTAKPPPPPTPNRVKVNSIKAALNPAGSRKTIPEGQPDCLAGVRLLFTGTFQTMDRVTSIATARRYGGEVVSKLEDTDYVVLGDRAGPKKLQVINELELETITEGEFFGMLKAGGVGDAKRQRVANKRRADEVERPGEDRRPVKAAKTAKGRAKKSSR